MTAAAAIPYRGRNKTLSRIFTPTPVNVIYMFVLNKPVPVRIIPVKLFKATPVTAKERIFRIKTDSSNLSVYKNLIIKSENKKSIRVKITLTAKSILRCFLKNKFTAFFLLLKADTRVRPET